jgi:hypothetical protein
MCEEWAAVGECTQNPGFMRYGCRAACALCAVPRAATPGRSGVPWPRAPPSPPRPLVAGGEPVRAVDSGRGWVTLGGGESPPERAVQARAASALLRLACLVMGKRVYEQGPFLPTQACKIAPKIMQRCKALQDSVDIQLLYGGLCMPALHCAWARR